MSRHEPNRTDEQFQVSITGIKIKMDGRAPLILALGIAAALGVVVIVKMPLLSPDAAGSLAISSSPSSLDRASGGAPAARAGAR